VFGDSSIKGVCKRMKGEYGINGLVLGILLLLILISFPSVSSDLYRYPREEGPYTVFIGGKPYGGGVSEPFFFNSTMGFQVGPFCSYQYLNGSEYDMLNGSIFIVNGEKQSYEFPAQIGLKGLKGFSPAINSLNFNILTGGRLRIFGVCDKIWQWYGLNVKSSVSTVGV